MKFVYAILHTPAYKFMYIAQDHTNYTCKLFKIISRIILTVHPPPSVSWSQTTSIEESACPVG